MSYSKSELTAALTVNQFPRSNAYDPEWVLKHLMGPNPLWLTEALTDVMNLNPGMRMLDLGCGRAVSSIFLTKEFGLQVWATDPRISASDNWQTISEAGVCDRVFPIHSEAHTLTFADGFFDALVSLDAYHYFGTDDLYLSYCTRFVKPGGQIGIVVPGLQDEFTSGIPEHLVPYWLPNYWSFHSPAWWQTHWEKTQKVEVVVADLIPDGWQYWLKWHEICLKYDFPFDQREADMLRIDAGRNLGFTRIVAHKK